MHAFSNSRVPVYMQAADAEKSFKAAKRMVSFMDASDMSAIAGEDSDGAAVAELYHQLADVLSSSLEGAHQGH